MSKCLVFVLCAVSLTTMVICAPGSENIREKQSTLQDVSDQLNGASRMKRQSLDTVEVVYLDAASLDPTKLRDLQIKEPVRLAPVQYVNNPRQSYQQIPNSNLELVSQNANYAVYKLKSDDAPLSELNGKKAQSSGNQYFSFDSEQYSGYPGGRDPPPYSPGSATQRPPPLHHPPPPPADHHRPPPPHHQGGPARPHHGPPPDYGWPSPHRGGPPDRYDDRPPHYHGGPPDRYDHRPPHHGGPPDRRPPPYHHGGPPDRRPPPYHHGGPPDRRPPPPRDGPDRFDNRPSYNRPPPPPPDNHRPPPPPPDHRPPPDQVPYDQGNDNNENTPNDNTSDKVIDGTQTSSTTEAETDDDQYQLDVRFSNDDHKGAETMKRDIPSRKTRARQLPHLSPFIFQASVVKPED